MNIQFLYRIMNMNYKSLPIYTPEDNQRGRKFILGIYQLIMTDSHLKNKIANLIQLILHIPVRPKAELCVYCLIDNTVNTATMVAIIYNIIYRAIIYLLQLLWLLQLLQLLQSLQLMPQGKDIIQFSIQI